MVAEVQKESDSTPLKRLNKKGLPYKWDLNIYEKCSHQCVYCYARKSNPSDEEKQNIQIRANVTEQLEACFRSPEWKKDVINMGGICDSYQAIEEEKGIMREVLRICIRYKNPVIIGTKSDLIIRDADLLDELAHYTLVHIPVSITSISEELSLQIEPGASLPLSRKKILEIFSKTKVHTALHLFPLIPYLADDSKTLKTLVEWAADTRVDYMYSGFLYLRGGARKNFFAFLEEYYPQYLEAYRILYKNGGADKHYKAKIHDEINKLKNQMKVPSGYTRIFGE